MKKAIKGKAINAGIFLKNIIRANNRKIIIRRLTWKNSIRFIISFYNLIKLFEEFIFFSY